MKDSLIACLVFSFQAFILYIGFKPFQTINNKKKTEGIIVSLTPTKSRKHKRTIYNAEIMYIVNNKEYFIKTNYNTTFKIGQKINIFYNEENPEESFHQVSIIIKLFTLIFFFVGIYFFVDFLMKIFEFFQGI